VLKDLIADWELLVNRAILLGQEHTVFYICHLLKNIFLIEIPIADQNHLIWRKLTFFEEKILERRITGISIPTWAQLILISAGRNWRERLAFVWESLFPRPDILRQVFANSPQISVKQLYWRRFLQILGMIKAGQ